MCRLPEGGASLQNPPALKRDSCLEPVLTGNTLEREFWGIKFNLTQGTPQSHHRLLSVFRLGNCVDTELDELGVTRGGHLRRRGAADAFRCGLLRFEYCGSSPRLLINLGPRTNWGLG